MPRPYDAIQRVARLGRMTTLSQVGIASTGNAPTDQTLTGVIGSAVCGVHKFGGPGWAICGKSQLNGSDRIAAAWADRRPIAVVGQALLDGSSEVS